MEFKDYVRIVLTHWLGVVILIIAGVAGGAAYNASKPKVFEATAQGYVSARPYDNSANSATLAQQTAIQKVPSYVAIATSADVAQAAVKDPALAGTTLPHDGGALAGHIVVGSTLNTQIINIEAKAATPQDAQTLANVWANALSKVAPSFDKAAAPTVDPSTGKPSTATSPTSPAISIRVIEATSPGVKILPRTKVNLAGGLLLGLLLGFAYAMARHQFDRRLKSSEEVQKKFGLPVIGMIPQSSHMRQDGGHELVLAVTGSNASSSASTAEGFRKLRTNLAYMDVDKPPRVIVVTSPKQSDGKSTVAANLAAAIAIGGQPVTLIDGDLRRPTVADSLAMVDGAGLTDVLVGRVKPADVIQDHPEVPGLRVLASGAIPPNPSELLGSNVMRSLIHELAQDAMVIIDAPPLLPVTDAAVLSRSADGAIVVISHNSTLDSELEASLGHIATVHGRTLGIVFNRMRRTATSGFYGGDYYRYEYRPEAGRRKSKERRAKASKDQEQSPTKR